MARNGSIRRFVTAIFDHKSAAKMEAEFAQSLGNAAEKGGKAFVRELRQEFDRSMGTLRKQLADGVIDEAEFKRRAASLARAFNTTLSREMDKARAAGDLTDREFVKLSKTFKNVETAGTGAFGRIRNSLTSLVSTNLGPLLAAGGILAGLRRANQEANELDASQRTLAATAKITGVQFEFLAQQAQLANDQFRFGVTLSNSFTIELAKLTEKAGDISQLSAAMRAFLDIGAARGLDANRTLQAIQQAILGIDEGTDKLFGKNPSAIYEEFAAAIGVSAAKLTDQQKAQALVNEALEDGEKVRGEYQRWLETAAGQQFLLTVEVEKTFAVIGKSLQPALIALIPVVSALAKTVAFLVNVLVSFVQLIGTTVLAGITGFTLAMAGAAKAGALLLTGMATLSDFLGADKTAAFFTKRAEAVNAEADALMRLTKALGQVTLGELGAIMGRLGLGPEPASAQGPPIKPPPKRTAGTGSDRVGDAVRGMRQRGLEERGFEGVDRSAWQSLAQQLGVREALLQPIVDESERAAEAFVSPWDKALVHIKDEVTQTGGLFGDLANAWAEGGVAGLAKLATAKVKENLARAIEMGAIALGQLVFGNTAGATLAAKSAATHAAAVPAWAALGAAVGGSGSKSAPTGGSFPSIGSTNTRNAADITQSAQVHIYIDPLNPDDPAYQRSVAAATKNAQERYGANTQVHIHRRRSG